jgi:hypothetical protein
MARLVIRNLQAFWEGPFLWVKWLTLSSMMPTPKQKFLQPKRIFAHPSTLSHMFDCQISLPRWYLALPCLATSLQTIAALSSLTGFSRSGRRFGTQGGFPGAPGSCLGWHGWNVLLGIGLFLETQKVGSGICDELSPQATNPKDSSCLSDGSPGGKKITLGLCEASQ